MAAKKKVAKTGKKTGGKKTGKTGKKAASSSSSSGEGGGGRGRKAVLTGCTVEQGKRMRRALRAAGIRLSDLGEGESVAMKEKGGNLICKIGKEEVSIPVEGRTRAN